MKTTPISHRNLILYQVFTRNHTVEGTFRALIKDLDRIKSLGVDIVYLLPIHPIGKKNRKGTLGSPYSIQDYRKINPELGTLEDFLALIEAVHDRKMKIMMDIVFNHTSRDSELLKTHPGWFYRNEAGEFANRVGEWWDITDFDFTKDKGLWVELADILVEYARMGLDGFRCDVASLVPVAFWSFARKKVSKINKKMIWLSESVHGGFVKYIRDRGFEAGSETEMFTVFDMAYEYDLQPYFDGYLKGKRPLRDYLEALARQEEIYPENYVKMSNLENHDFDRIASYVNGDPDKIRNWTALAFFQKAAVMLYAGEEYSSDRRPDLFEKDVVVKKVDISEHIRNLVRIKKHPVFVSGKWNVHIPEVDGVAYNSVENEKEKWVGIFNVGQKPVVLPVELSEGKYRNVLNGKTVRVEGGILSLGSDPIIIRIRK
jgi:glycosidase